MNPQKNLLDLLNLGEWLGSKKTTDMLWTQAILLLILVVLILAAKADPEKLKALLLVLWPYLLGIFGLGMGKMGAQGLADIGRSKPHEVLMEAEKEERTARSGIAYEQAKADFQKAAHAREASLREAELAKLKESKSEKKPE